MLVVGWALSIEAEIELSAGEDAEGEAVDAQIHGAGAGLYAFDALKRQGAFDQ